MANQKISLGTNANDGTGDTLRSAGTKVNSNFAEIYALLNGGDSSSLATKISLTDSNNGAIIFEGSSVDQHETILASTNATKDNTILLPDSSGNVALTTDLPIAGTGLTKTGKSLSVNTSQTQITAVGTLASITTSGAGVIGTTLRSVGNFDVNTNKFNITASNGNTDIAGTLGVTGNFDVNTNKFTVNATSGNTVSAGSITGTSVEVSGTSGTVKLPTLTTTQRNALSAANGMLIYNSTDSKIQAYAGGAWVNLH